MESAAYGLLIAALILVLLDLVLGIEPLGFLSFAALVAGAGLLIAAGGPPGWLTPLLWAGVAIVFAGQVWSIVRVRRAMHADEARPLVGRVAIARTDLTPHGEVAIKGERWQAVIVRGTAREGDTVRVVGAEGSRLRVERER